MKYFEVFPSVLILTVPFSTEWAHAEWGRRESSIYERFLRFRNLLSPRDIKIIVLVIKVGSTFMEKVKKFLFIEFEMVHDGNLSLSSILIQLQDVLDERISALKRHLQLDSKTFACLSPSDFSQAGMENSSSLRKICKSAREYSSYYYSSQIKKMKTAEKGIAERFKPPVEYILRARYNFKIAFLYEFLRQQQYSLQYYRQCYHFLISAIDCADEGIFDQIKYVAEIVHYKICNFFLASSVPVEAYQQFRLHIARFAKLYCEFPWQHYSWLSDQFLVFVQLLEKHVIADASPESDRSYYYHNAALYARKRAVCYEQIKKQYGVERLPSVNPFIDHFLSSLADSNASEKSPPAGNTKFRGMTVIAPKYIGSQPQLVDPILDQVQGSSEEILSMYTEYMRYKETKVRHHDMIMTHLQNALTRLLPYMSRRRSLIHSLMAELYMKEKDFELAKKSLQIALQYFSEEQSLAPTVKLLLNITKCATRLGRPSEFLEAALAIYSHSTATAHPCISNSELSSIVNLPSVSGACRFVSREALELLHLDIVSLLEETLRPNYMDAEKRLVGDSSTFRTTLVRDRLYVPLVRRPEYGSHAAATADGGLAVVEKKLPDDFIVQLSDATANLLIVKTHFEKPIAELGETITVTVRIESKFIDVMEFDDVVLYFTENCVVQQFENSSSSCLKFLPASPIEIEFSMHISELSFSRFLSPDALVCLERAVFTIRRRDTVADPADTTNSSASEIKFNVDILPDAVLKARAGEAAKKAFSLKDALKFHYNNAYPTLSIQKPVAFVSLVTPKAYSKTEPLRDGVDVTLLAGALQRVDVVFAVGDVDMIDGKVSLSSDFTPDSVEKSLFWFPDRARLSSVLSNESQMLKLAEGHTASKAEYQKIVRDVNNELDSVRFSPLRVNTKSMQPAQNLILPPSLSAGSQFTVPVFVRLDTVVSSSPSSASKPSAFTLTPKSSSSSNGSGNGGGSGSTDNTGRAQKRIVLTMKVEYLPKGIVKSVVSKDFCISLLFVNPFEVIAEFSCPPPSSSSASPIEQRSSVLSVNEANFLTTSLLCTNSLRREIEILHNKIEISSTVFVNKFVSDGTIGIAPNVLISTVEDHASNFQNYNSHGCIQLHKGEVVSKAYKVQCRELEDAPAKCVASLPYFTSSEPSAVIGKSRAGTYKYVSSSHKDNSEAKSILPVSLHDLYVPSMGDLNIVFKCAQPHILRGGKEVDNAQSGKADWLPHFAARNVTSSGGGEDDPVDRSFSLTVKSRLSFSLPPVRVSFHFSHSICMSKKKK